MAEPTQPQRITGAETLLRSKWFWFLAAAAFLATRHPGELLVAQLRDEDGIIFFQHALVWGGWSTVWWPYSGYFHLVPRIIAAGCRALPIEWTPLAYSLAGLALVASVAARVGTARLPRIAAAAGALALFVVPGYGVGCINICLLHFSLAALIAVNLLEPPPESNPETAWRGAQLIVAALSGPEGLVLAPLALLRGWQWRRSWRGVVLIGTLGAGALAQAIVFLGDRRTGEAQWPAALPSLGVLSRYAKLLFGGWFGAPSDPRVAAAVLAVACAAFLGLWLARGQRFRGPSLLVLAGGFAFLSAGRIVSTHWGHPYDFGARHLFLPFAAVLWSLGWLAAGTTGWRRVPAAVLALAIVASALPRWSSEPEPDLHWRAQVAALREGRSPIFADTRVLGWRSVIPLRHSAVLWVPGLGNDGLVHAYAVSVPRPGPVTDEDPGPYLARQRLP